MMALERLSSTTLENICLEYSEKPIPASISTSHQRYFKVLDQRGNNVDPTLKMKQNSTSDFQGCVTLIQRQCQVIDKIYLSFI